MGLGTLTDINGDVGQPQQTVFYDEISIPLDNSYPTGGYTGLQAKLQTLRKDQREILEVTNITAGASGGYLAQWDRANGKLLLYGSNGASPAALAQIASGTDLNAVTLKLLVKSR
jgi:hypothetical protein